MSVNPATDDRGRRAAPDDDDDDDVEGSMKPDGPDGGELGGGVTWRILAETAESRARLETAAECSDKRRY